MTFAIGALIPLAAFLGGSVGFGRDSRSRSQPAAVAALVVGGTLSFLTNRSAVSFRRCARCASARSPGRSPTVSAPPSVPPRVRRRLSLRRQRAGHARRELGSRGPHLPRRTGTPSRFLVRAGGVTTCCGRCPVVATVRRWRWLESSRSGRSPACSRARPGAASRRLRRSPRMRELLVEIAPFLAEGSDGLVALQRILAASNSLEGPGVLVACTHGDVLVGLVDGLVASGGVADPPGRSRRVGRSVSTSPRARSPPCRSSPLRSKAGAADLACCRGGARRRGLRRTPGPVCAWMPI